jgi:WD40 repeat protein
MTSENPGTDREHRVNRILADYLEAQRLGQKPEREDLLRRYPDLADELHSFFADQDRFGRLADRIRPPAAPAPPGEPPSLAPGEVVDASAVRETVLYFGDYELLEEIARGGMGIVYKARQVSLGRTVALKMILAGQFASPDEVQRFYREAEAAANLDHPNVVPIYEVGEHQGQHFFSMKLIEGESLAGAAARGQSWAADKEARKKAAVLVASVARTVHHAHQRGVLHRDLKPGNILLDGQGQPHVTDFGLAKRVAGDTQFTRTGAIVGTPSYMPPEQARAEKVLTTGVDVYSLGAILYELLTGSPPFRAQSPLDTVLQVLEREPESPRKANPRIDRDLETICLKCLEKDPQRRYDSAAALANDLERWLNGEAIRARPSTAVERFVKWARRRPAVAALVGVSAAAAVALVTMLAVSIYVVSEKQAATEQANRDLVQANRQVVAEKEHTQKALEDRTVALAGEQRAGYFTRVGLAYDQWRQDNAARSAQLLEACAEPLRGWEWHYLRRLTRAERVAITAHPRGAGVLAFSSDGKRLLTAGSDGTVRVWDAWSGKKLLNFPAHSATVRAAVFSPDGQRIVSCSKDEVRVWDGATGKLLAPLAAPSGGAGLAFSADGKRLAVVGTDKQTRVIDVAANKVLFTVPAASVAFSPDGKLLVTAAESVVLRDAADGKELHKLDGAGAGVTSLSFSGDGRRLVASGGKSLAVVVWDVAGRQILFNQRLWVTAALSPDGQRLAAGGDRQVRFWDLKTGTELPPLHGLDHWVLGLAYSPDGQSFATATGDPLSGLQELGDNSVGTLFLQMSVGAILPQRASFEVRVWDAPAAQEGRPLATGNGLGALAFRRDGLLALGRDGAIELWDLAGRRMVRELIGHDGAVTCLAFSPEGDRLVSGGADRTTRVWDVASGREVRRGPQHASALTAVVVLTDGLRVASAAGDETVKTWDLGTGQEVWRAFGPAAGATHLAPVAPKTLLRCSTGAGAMTNTGIEQHPGAAQFFDTATGLKRSTLDGIKGYVKGIAVSPDGRQLALLSSLSLQGDGVVQIFDAATGRELRQLTGDSGILTALAFTPDGARLAVAAGLHIKLWDVAEGLEIITLPEGASRLAFSPDGQFLVTVVGTEVRVFEATPPAPRIGTPVAAAAVRPPAPPLSNELPPDPLPAAARAALRNNEEALTENDPAAALLWSVRALRSDPEHADRHRVHVGLLRQSLPPLGGAQPLQLTPELPPNPGPGQIKSSLSPDGRLIAYHRREGGSWVQVFDVRTGKEAGPRIRLAPEVLDDGSTPVCFTPGGRRIVVCLQRTVKQGEGHTYRFRAYDIGTGTPAGPEIGFVPPPEPDWRIYTCRVMGDGSWLVVECGKGPQSNPAFWHAWNLATGKELSQAERFNRVAFSADGRFVLTGWSADGGSSCSGPAAVRDLRTGQPVGPGLLLPRGFFMLSLSHDGQAALVADEDRQVRVYSVSEGRCILARSVRVATNSLAFSPAGNWVALWDQAQGAAGIVEVRDVATGRLLAAPLPTPSQSNHVDFSADGRLLAVEASSSVRLLDVETGLPLGPWLAFTTSGQMAGDLPNNDFRLAADNATMLTRADWPNGKLHTSRFRVWDLNPDTRPIEQLETLAELHAGRRLTDAGEVVPLSLDEYRRRWQEARGQHPEWFTAQAPKLPEKVPALPAPKPLALGQPLPRPVQMPDYAAVFGRFGGADRPPLVSLAAGLQDNNDGVRRAALEAVLTLKLDRPLVLALLVEALKDSGVRDRAFAGLGSLGPEAAPALPALLAELRLELRLARKYNVFGSGGGDIARALGRIGPGAAEAVPALRESIACIPPRTFTPTEVEAARALGRIGPAADEAIPELIGLLLKYPDPTRRMFWFDPDRTAVIVRAIERVTARSTDKLVPHLAKALALPPGQRLEGETWILPEAYFDRRIGVVELIVRLGPRVRGTAAALGAVLAEPPSKNPRDLLRPAAAEALWRVEGKAEALAVLIATLAEPIEKRDPDPNTRRGRAAMRLQGGSSRHGRAAVALGRIGEPAKAALPALLAKVEKGVSIYDRLDAAEAVWRLTGDAKPVLPLLRTVLEAKLEGGDLRGPDKKAPVRAIAILGLMGKAARDAAPALAAAIRAEDEANARGTVRVGIPNADEEDEDINTSDLLRRIGLPLLRTLDPAAARALEVPVKMP